MPRSRSASVPSLLRTLNDPARGALLDALIEVRSHLSPPSPSWESQTLGALAEGLLERLAAAGIRPLLAVGLTLSLTPSQLVKRFEYHGSPFLPSQRRKRVVVASPGWTVGNRMVIRPTVREQVKEETA